MKRMISLTAALLLLLLALAGCGGNSQEAAEAESAEAAETVEPAEAETAEATEPAAETAAAPESGDLTALLDQMISEAGITDTLQVGRDTLLTVYGLNADQITDIAGINASSGGAFPQEIVVVKAVDEDAAASVAMAFMNRLSEIASQAESYDPDSYALAQNCSVITRGNYVGLFFSEDYAQLSELFQNAVG